MQYRVLKTVGFLCVHVIVHGAVVVCCKHPSPATKNTTKKGADGIGTTSKMEIVFIEHHTKFYMGTGGRA